MAVTRSADVANQIPEVWADDLYMQATKQTFWQRFTGPKGSGMPVVEREDLTQDVGDTVKIDIVLNLTGSGQTGDTALLEDNEEKIKFRQTSVTVDSRQNAVRWSKKAQHFITHDMRETAQDLLARWYAGILDDDLFTVLTAATVPTKNKWACGSATTRNTVADGDTTGRLTLAEISRIKAYFQTEIKGEPISMENGEEIFGMVIHPYAALSLKLNDTNWAQAQREAQVRGTNNPLFTGALGMWDGVVLYEAQRVPRSNNTNDPIVATADNIFFGAQAASRAWSYYPDWAEQQFSYGQETGIATMGIYGQAANIFDLNSTETGGDATDDTAIGHMVVYSAAVAPTQP